MVGGHHNAEHHSSQNYGKTKKYFCKIWHSPSASDNGPQFVSDEFRNFVNVNGIRHICTAVYHPASNDEAERFVQKHTEEGKDRPRQFIAKVRPVSAKI